uniref:Uncharacterized protein n=1 Tax=viral metagenome TaxID=1070528 RepID=A0A6C0H5C1_9ZZZZ
MCDISQEIELRNKINAINNKLNIIYEKVNNLPITYATIMHIKKNNKNIFDNIIIELKNKIKKELNDKLEENYNEIIYVDGKAIIDSNPAKSEIDDIFDNIIIELKNKIKKELNDKLEDNFNEIIHVDKKTVIDSNLVEIDDIFDNIVIGLKNEINKIKKELNDKLEDNFNGKATIKNNSVKSEIDDLIKELDYINSKADFYQKMYAKPIIINEKKMCEFCDLILTNNRVVNYNINSTEIFLTYNIETFSYIFSIENCEMCYINDNKNNDRFFDFINNSLKNINKVTFVFNKHKSHYNMQDINVIKNPIIEDNFYKKIFNGKIVKIIVDSMIDNDLERLLSKLKNYSNCLGIEIVCKGYLINNDKFRYLSEYFSSKNIPFSKTYISHK